MHFIVPLCLLLQDIAADNSGLVDNALGSLLGNVTLAGVLFWALKSMMDRQTKDSDRHERAHESLSGKVDGVHDDVKEMKTLMTTGQACRINNPQKTGV